MTARGRLLVARTIAIGGLGLTVIGTLMPWLRSGERSRSSYQLAGLAGRMLDGTTAAVAHAWLIYPLVVAAAIAALLLHPSRAFLVAAAIVTLVAALFAIAVSRAPLPGLFGLWVTCAGALVVIPSLAIAVTLPQEES